MEKIKGGIGNKTKKKMNKRGNLFAMIIFFGAIAVLVATGIMFAIGGVIVDYTADEIFPEINNIGVIDDTNYSYYIEGGTTAMDSVIEQYTWMGGLIFVIGVVLILGLAFVFRLTAERWTIPIFIVVALLVIMLCMFMSNIYEDFYNDGDAALSDRLREQTLLSYMILYSPAIMSVIIFIGGIIMFGGVNNEPSF